MRICYFLLDSPYRWQGADVYDNHKYPFQWNEWQCRVTLKDAKGAEYDKAVTYEDCLKLTNSFKGKLEPFGVYVRTPITLTAAIMVMEEDWTVFNSASINSCEQLDEFFEKTVEQFFNSIDEGDGTLEYYIGDRSNRLEVAKHVCDRNGENEDVAYYLGVDNDKAAGVANDEHIQPLIDMFNVIYTGEVVLD